MHPVLQVQGQLVYRRWTGIPTKGSAQKWHDHCIISQNILFQKNQGYEQIGEGGATDSESLLGDRGGADQHSFARRQRRSPSMGYDSAGSNSPDSQSRKNSNEQVRQIYSTFNHSTS